MKKKKRLAFAPFKSIFFVVEKKKTKTKTKQSLSNTKWFYCKKCKIEKGNMYLIWIQLGKKEMWFDAVCYWENIIFNEIAPDFTHYQKKCTFLK